MSLVFDERTNLNGKPGLHALIAGVSAYPHLPVRGETGGEASYGMKQLSSTSLTAYKMYEWLLSHRDDFPVPLATCRMLLSPTEEEKTTEPELETVGASPCTDDEFIDAAGDWRKDASSHKDNMTFFYFAGHGVQRSKDDAIILLQEFGDGKGGALRHGVDVNNLFFGMAPAKSGSRSSIARTQIYFVDACRNLPSKFKDYDLMHTLPVFNVERSGRDDRRAPVFYAALADSRAYALRGEQTVFSKALLECLSIATDDPIETDQGNLKWPVTFQSLNSALTDHFEDLSASEKADQDFTLSGWVKDAPLHYLDQPPPVDVVIEVKPEDALSVTRLKVLDERGEVAKTLPVPLNPHPFRLAIPAGTYGLTADIHPPNPTYHDYTRWRPVKPPNVKWPVKVTS